MKCPRCHVVLKKWEPKCPKCSFSIPKPKPKKKTVEKSQKEIEKTIKEEVIVKEEPEVVVEDIKNTPNVVQEDIPDISICQKCGAITDIGDKFCSKCGCPKNGDVDNESSYLPPVNNYNVPFKSKGKKIGIIVSVIIALIGIIIGSIVLINKHNEKVKEEYKEALIKISLDMLEGAAKAEDCGNLITSVWFDAIYEKYDSETYKYTHDKYGDYYDDFNDALSSLFSDSDYKYELQKIENNQESVRDQMKKLMDPPEEYEEAYRAVKEFYNKYTKFTNLVLNPEGSYNSFSAKFSELDAEVVDALDEVKLYIDLY